MSKSGDSEALGKHGIIVNATSNFLGQAYDVILLAAGCYDRAANLRDVSFRKCGAARTA